MRTRGRANVRAEGAKAMSTADQHQKELRGTLSFLGRASPWEKGMDYTIVAKLRYTICNRALYEKKTHFGRRPYQQYKVFHCVRQRKALYKYMHVTGC